MSIRRLLVDKFFAMCRWALSNVNLRVVAHPDESPVLQIAVVPVVGLVKVVNDKTEGTQEHAIVDVEVGVDVRVAVFRLELDVGVEGHFVQVDVSLLLEFQLVSLHNRVIDVANINACKLKREIYRNFNFFHDIEGRPDSSVD